MSNKPGRFRINWDNYKYKRLTRALIEKYRSLTRASYQLGYSHTAILDMLQGKSAPRKDLIDNVLEAVGLTYEEAFEEDYQ